MDIGNKVEQDVRLKIFRFFSGTLVDKRDNSIKYCIVLAVQINVRRHVEDRPEIIKGGCKINMVKFIRKKVHRSHT